MTKVPDREPQHMKHSEVTFPTRLVGETRLCPRSRVHTRGSAARTDPRTPPASPPSADDVPCEGRPSTPLCLLFYKTMLKVLIHGPSFYVSLLPLSLTSLPTLQTLFHLYRLLYVGLGFTSLARQGTLETGPSPVVPNRTPSPSDRLTLGDPCPLGRSWVWGHSGTRPATRLSSKSSPAGCRCTCDL